MTVSNIGFNGEGQLSSMDIACENVNFHGTLSILNVFSVLGDLVFDGTISLDLGAKTVDIISTSSSINFAIEFNGLFRSITCKTEGIFSGIIKISWAGDFTVDVDATSMGIISELTIVKDDMTTYASDLTIDPQPLRFMILENGIYFNGKASIGSYRYVDKLLGQDVVRITDLNLDGDITIEKLGDKHIRIASENGFIIDLTRTRIRVLDLEFGIGLEFQGDLEVTWGDGGISFDTMNGFTGTFTFSINGWTIIGRDWDWSPGSTIFEWDLDNDGYFRFDSQLINDFTAELLLPSGAGIIVEGENLDADNLKVEWDPGPLGNINLFSLRKTGEISYSMVDVDIKIPADPTWYNIFPLGDGDCMPSAIADGPHTTYADDTVVTFDASETFCANKIRWDFNADGEWDTGTALGGHWINFGGNEQMNYNYQSYYDEWFEWLENNDCGVTTTGGTGGTALDCAYISAEMFFAKLEAKRVRPLLPDVIDRCLVQVTINYKYSTFLDVEMLKVSGKDRVYENDPFTILVSERGSGADIEGATVTYETYNDNNILAYSETATTDAQGGAYFTAIEVTTSDGNMRSKIIVYHPDYDELEMEFQIWSSGGIISGYVKDAVTGQYLSDVQITASGSATTDNNGFYELLIPTGTYDITYSKDGYQNFVVSNMQIDEGDDIQMPVVNLNPGLTVTAYGPENGSPGVEYEFHGTATGGTLPYNWYWDFDDGTVKTEQHPDHAFSSTGTYNVKVIVEDDLGDVAMDTITVVINYNEQPDTPDFTYSPSNPKIDESISFTATDLNDPDGEIVRVMWDWGDGEGTSWIVSIYRSHSYDSAGTYAVTVSVKDNAGATNSRTRSVTVSTLVNKAPHAIICISGGCATPTSSYTHAGVKDVEYTFSGSQSYDPDGSIVAYGWESDACFLGGTKISMADGMAKNIEDVQIGDIVKAYDEITQTVKNSVVTKVYHHAVEEMSDYYMIINNKLRVTPNHVMYVNGGWYAAENIKIGDILLDIEGEEIKVTSIEKVYEKQQTYNLEIKEYHTYYAENILVHNVKTWAWRQSSSISPFKKTFTSNGVYTLTLHVRDNGGKEAETDMTIQITDSQNN